MFNFFYQNSPTKKGLAIALAITIIFSAGGWILLYPKPVQAVVCTDPGAAAQRTVKFTWDKVWDGMKFAWEKVKESYHSAASWISAKVDIWKEMDTWYERAIKQAWNILRKQLLDMLVDNIIKWIQGGGNPKFVTDWKGFLKDAANQAGGRFVDEYLGMGYLCDPFDMEIKIALSGAPTFTEEARCTLEDIGVNIQNFYDDFSEGGWKGWIKLVEPQNNLYGAYLMALDEKIGIESAAKESAKNEAVASAGFLGDKVCRRITCANPDGTRTTRNGIWKEEEITEDEFGFCSCDKWDVRTPGKIIAESISKAVTVDIDWLISSKEFNEYMGAIIDAVANRAIREGVAAMKNNDTYIEQGSPPSVSVQLTALEHATEYFGTVYALIEQEELLKENLENLLSEHQINLAILNQIEAVQTETLDIARSIAEHSSCSMPPGTIIDTIDTIIQGSCSDADPPCPCTETTIETIPIDITEIGSTDIEITTVREYTQRLVILMPWMPLSCDNIDSVNITSQLFNISTAAQATIDQIDNNIADTQVQINTLSTAISNTTAYGMAIENYQEAYENEQRGNSDAEATQNAEDAMWLAEQTAIPSIQAALNSPSDSLNSLLSEIQDLSMQAVLETNDVQTRRGYSQDCSYAETGTYYRDNCNANAKKNQFQNTLTACGLELIDISF